MGKLSVVIGAQWGDEGKGKWVDQIAKDLDIVCRFQGGNNAGHTIYIEGQKHVLHLLPNGVFYPHTKIALTSAVVIDPVVLLKEIQDVSSINKLTADRLWVSPNCHVITPWHVFQDTLSEEKSINPIGTTRRGIGPTYADRALRKGLLFSEFVNDDKRKQWIMERVELDERFKRFYDEHEQIWKAFEATVPYLKDYLHPAETYVRRALQENKQVLCEGAQGVLLDLAHGSYPFVTANSTHAAQAAVSLGIDPRKINSILGVAKVYATRVGSGPFPTELKDDIGRTLLEKGSEYGSTTRRPRRCGWFDAVAMRFAQELNGFDGIYINKLDILTGFSELKICVAYKHPRLGLLDEYPSEADILSECTPVYESYPGWKDEIPKSGNRQDLPSAAQHFLSQIETLAKIKILKIGTGADRGAFVS